MNLNYIWSEFLVEMFINDTIKKKKATDQNSFLTGLEPKAFGKSLIYRCEILFTFIFFM